MRASRYAQFSRTDVADVSCPKDKLLWKADFFFLAKHSSLFDYPTYR
ncbi:MAG: hypothetical protein WCF18_04365 [Chthoniobacteraceae bacterium]